MKVLFIVTAYPRHEGDVITPWMGETIERLRQRGIEVEVLAPSYRAGGAELVNGVKVHRFRYAPSRIESLTHDMPALERIARNPLFAALLPAYVAAGTAAAARVARDGRFDVVHAFWPIPHGLFALAAKRASGAALVSTFFSAELNWRGMTRTLVAPLLRRIVAGSDAVTVISSYTRERLREYAPGVESVIIPFGAAAVGRTPLLGESAAPASTRRPQDVFELLFVGRLVRRKGVTVLLRAAAILAGDRRLRVRIVGAGPEKDALLSEANRLGLGDRVTFEGIVDAVQLDDIFRRCDALVLPAIVTETGDTEGLGVVLIEAMGHGKPVIASAAGGIVDIVRDGDTGILVPPGDASALARAIVRAMDEPAELAALADRGAASARKEFGWDLIIARLSETYEAAVERLDHRL